MMIRVLIAPLAFLTSCNNALMNQVGIDKLKQDVVSYLDDKPPMEEAIRFMQENKFDCRVFSDRETLIKKPSYICIRQINQRELLFMIAYHRLIVSLDFSKDFILEEYNMIFSKGGIGGL